MPVVQMRKPEIEWRRRVLDAILVDLVEDPESRLLIEAAVRDLIQEYVVMCSQEWHGGFYEDPLL